MTTPTPPSGAEQSDSDGAVRHAPSTLEAEPSTTALGGASSGAGSTNWRNPEATNVLKGEAKPGGADSEHPHLFHLSEAAANVYDGGGLQGAHDGNWPILKGQNGAVYLARLEPGGVREPHWHPSAWELNFVIQGKARWTVVGPNSTQESFEAAKGDLVFAPQGHFHYFENASDEEDLIVFIAFNSSAREPEDDIGLVQAFKAMPADVLAAVFGGSRDMFASLPGKHERVVIARKQGT